MALLTCDFFSDALEMGTSITVVLPQRTAAQIGVATDGAPTGPPPVLYLLHGLSDDHTAWTRYTSIERYATAAGLAVVMPAVGRSFYADEVGGHPYWTYLSEELPEIVASFFGVSQRPEETFVAGLSMGGYGALKLALRHPERFGAAASLSGALDLREMATRADRKGLFQRVYGDQGAGPDDDLFELISRADGSALPPLFLSCGLEEDRLMRANRRFAGEATARGAQVRTLFLPGRHDWANWDRVIPEVVAWLPLPGRPAPTSSTGGP